MGSVTAVLLAMVAPAVLIGSVVWILGQALAFFSNIILPLSVAGVLALVLYPVVDYLEKSTGLSRVAATSFILLTFMAIIGGAVLLLAPIVSRPVSHAKEVLSVFSSRTQQTVMYCMDVFVRQVTALFQGQLVIAVIMGVMLATGCTLIGLKGGVLIGGHRVLDPEGSAVSPLVR